MFVLEWYIGISSCYLVYRFPRQCPRIMFMYLYIYINMYEERGSDKQRHAAKIDTCVSVFLEQLTQACLLADIRYVSNCFRNHSSLSQTPKIWGLQATCHVHQIPITSLWAERICRFSFSQSLLVVQVEKRRLSEERVATDLDLACGSVLLYTAVFVYRVVTGMSCLLATGLDGIPRFNMNVPCCMVSDLHVWSCMNVIIQ